MSDLKHKTNETIDDAAAAAKKAAATVIEKSKDVAHAAGDKLADAARQLKKA